MGITEIISLISGICLFLFGMTLMGDGLKKVAGNKLEIILFKLTGNRFKGILLGTLVTAVIQSSSAVSATTVGFVNSGMMKVKHAAGIILGAILGTSITGWIICLSSVSGGSGLVELLSTSTLTGIVALIGIGFRMFGKKQYHKHLGDILMGFAVLMFGMSAMSSAVSPLKDDPTFTALLTKFSNPFLGILVGILFTAVIQSASAAIGILEALAVTGALTFSAALPITMGVGIGAAVPVLISALGANASGKQTAFMYLFFQVFGVLLLAPIFYILNAIFHFDIMSTPLNMVGVSLLNTVFRLIVVLIMTPLITPMVKFVSLIFKEKEEDANETADIDRLEERFLIHPALAIEQSRNAVNEMAVKSLKNFYRAQKLLTDFSEAGLEKVRAKEDIIDKYEDKIDTYLVKLTEKELTKSQNQDVTKFLHTITDFERIGDHDQNIAEIAQEIYEKKLQFSIAAQNELSVMASAIEEILKTAIEAFCEENIDKAYRVEPLEEHIDDLCRSAKDNHISRIQKGNCSLTQGFVFNDLLTNYERIADHCSNIALALISIRENSFDAHEYIKTLKEKRTETFNRYFEEYTRKYNFETVSGVEITQRSAKQ